MTWGSLFCTITPVLNQVTPCTFHVWWLLSASWGIMRAPTLSYSFPFFFFLSLALLLPIQIIWAHASLEKSLFLDLCFNEAQQRSCTEPECSSYSPQSLQCIPNTAILLYDSYLGMSRSHLSSTPPYSFTHARTHSSNTYWVNSMRPDLGEQFWGSSVNNSLCPQRAQYICKFLDDEGGFQQSAIPFPEALLSTMVATNHK